MQFVHLPILIYFEKRNTFVFQSWAIIFLCLTAHLLFFINWWFYCLSRTAVIVFNQSRTLIFWSAGQNLKKKIARDILDQGYSCKFWKIKLVIKFRSLNKHIWEIALHTYAYMHVNNIFNCLLTDCVLDGNCIASASRETWCIWTRSTHKWHYSGSLCKQILTSYTHTK